MGAVYDLIARALPVEGRDYAVDFVFDSGRVATVSLRPYNELGRFWCDYCTKLLRSMSRKESA
jgi:hypothetical protein